MYSVLCCGSNGAGQLGLEHQEDVSEMDECFRSEHRVFDIACGSNHSILLLENGQAYACGSGVRNLVGFEDIDMKFIDKFEPVQQNGKRFQHVGAGWDFSVFIDVDDKIYVFGNLSLCGGLGSSRKEASILIESFHQKNDTVVELQTSLHSVIVIYGSGIAVGWGNNKKGQLFGDCQPTGMIWSPSTITFDDISCEDKNTLHVVNCAMGRDYTLFHVQDRASENEYVIMRCKNDRYNILHDLFDLLGEGTLVGPDKRRSRWFKLKKGLKLHRLKSMWSSVHVMYTTDKSGSNMVLKSFGNNVFNQLFPGISKKLGEFDVGTEHGVCTEQNKKKVYSWGWGEHGNCGIQQGMNKANELYSCNEDEIIDSIRGGYATTWAVVRKGTNVNGS